ncbi:MAG: hypothetical protein ABI548_25330 [Polyangiaceae bacterium]
MIIAAIPRAAGQLVVTIDPHPKTGKSMVVVAHVQADEKVIHRTALQASELKDVISALTLASQTLAARRPQHRTISAAEQLAEDRRLF